MNALNSLPKSIAPGVRIQKISRAAWVLFALVFVLNLIVRWQGLLREFELAHLDRVNFFSQLEQLIWSLFWSGFFVKLFRLFEKGQVFTGNSINCLRVLGVVCIGKFVVDAVWSSIVISTQNPAIPGFLWWSLLNNLVYNPNLLVAGLATLLVAYLLDQARMLKEEQDLTI